MAGFRQIGRKWASSPALWFSLGGGMAAYLCAVYSLGTPPLPVIYPDSTSYWKVAQFVPLGYPAFIHAIYAVTGSLKPIVVFQIGAFSAAVLMLQVCVAALMRSQMLAGILALVLFCYHGLALQSVNLLTEELFIAALLLHVAATAIAIARGSKVALTMMALTAVIAVSLRPAAYFMFATMAVLAIIWKDHRRLVALWGGVPLVAFTLILIMIGLVTRGIATQTATGLDALPHVALLYDGGGRIPAETEQQILRALEPFRLEWQKRSNWLDRAEFEDASYSPIFSAVIPIIAKTMPHRSDNDVAELIAFHTVVRHPVEYAELAARTIAYGFNSFALGVDRSAPDGLLHAYVKAEGPRARPSLQALMGSKTNFDPKQDAAKYFMLTHYPVPQIGTLGSWRYALFAWTGIVTLFSWINLLMRRRSEESLFVAYVSILLITGYGLLGLAALIIERYAIPLDALMIIIMVTGVALAAPLRSQSRPSPLAASGQTTSHDARSNVCAPRQTPGACPGSFPGP